MAARPFRVVSGLPRPLSVEETAEKFGLSLATVDAARRVLVNGSDSRKRGVRSGRLVTKTQARKAAPRKRRAR